MHKSYRLKLEEMIEDHALNQEILIHCIAVMNKKVNRAYAGWQTLTAYNDYDKEWKEYQETHHLPPYYHIRSEDVSAAKKNFEELIAYRKPFLDLVMKGYRINLDTVKSLVSQADNNKLPTYKMVDRIRKIIIDLNYKLT